MRGLEPRASCSQSRRATNCATPRYEIVELPGRFLPKLARYQLRNTRISHMIILCLFKNCNLFFVAVFVVMCYYALRSVKHCENEKET